jgi:hypothetical protein
MTNKENLKATKTALKNIEKVYAKHIPSKWSTLGEGCLWDALCNLRKLKEYLEKHICPHCGGDV